MPTFSAQTTHGPVPGSVAGLGLVQDEGADLTMQSVTRNGTATKTQYRDSDGNTYALVFSDHILTMALTADLIGVTSGDYPTFYSGQAIASRPANWSVYDDPNPELLWFGHRWGDGVTVIEDPSLEASADVTEAPSYSCNLVNYPWVA